MSFVLLLVNNIVAINEAILEPNELQGMAGDKSLEGRGYQWLKTDLNTV
jgi:hypothetical protein